MNQSVWLSLKVGVPLALIAVALLFWVEANHVGGRPSSRSLKVSAAVASLVLVGVALARFVAYA